jgi:hypothetical protein
VLRPNVKVLERDNMSKIVDNVMDVINRIIHHGFPLVITYPTLDRVYDRLYTVTRQSDFDSWRCSFFYLCDVHHDRPLLYLFVNVKAIRDDGFLNFDMMCFQEDWIRKPLRTEAERCMIMYL